MEIPFANGQYAVNEQGIQTAQTPSLGQWQEGEDGPTQEAVRPRSTRPQSRSTRTPAGNRPVDTDGCSHTIL